MKWSKQFKISFMQAKDLFLSNSADKCAKIHASPSARTWLVWRIEMLIEEHEYNTGVAWIGLVKLGQLEAE